MKTSRRNFLKTGAAGAAAVAPAARAQPPNILLVLSDDHSVPRVGCYANPDIKTPNLDRLASQGIRFDRVYVTCPQCMPSRASMMTGRSPVAIQMTRFTAPLPMEVRTYPELLRASGYFTGVAGRDYHLDGDSSIDSAKVLDRYSLRTFRRRVDLVKTSRSGGEAVAQFGEFLDAAPKNRPFFLQLCFHDPHRPLDKNAIPQPHDPKKLTLPLHYPDTALVGRFRPLLRFDRTLRR